MTHKEDAVSIILAALKIGRNPVVMFSGGKDSTVMLHLLIAMGLRFPLIFHREPFFSEKYEFANKLIQDWGLVAHDWPPVMVSMWQGKEMMAYTNHYQIGHDGQKPLTLDLPKNILEPEEGLPWLCGVDQFLNRPTGLFNYPWDMAFIGHKSCDEDQIAGKIPLHCDIVPNKKGPAAAFPLRNWTNEQVWDYLDEHDVPIQEDRYDGLSRSELPDKRANSDYFHACIRCVDIRLKGKSVTCLKTGRQMQNVSEQVPYRALKNDYYG